MEKIAVSTFQKNLLCDIIEKDMSAIPEGQRDALRAYVRDNVREAVSNQEMLEIQQDLSDLLANFMQINGLEGRKEVTEYVNGVIKTMGAYVQQYGPKMDLTDRLRQRYDRSRGDDDQPIRPDATPTVPGGRKPAPIQVQMHPTTPEQAALYGKNPAELIQDVGTKARRPVQPLWARPASSEAEIKTSANDTKTDSDVYEAIMKAMLGLADAADKAGLHSEADKIAKVLPLLGTLKTAQYEGFQNYWIANGRAFENAWKAKRTKGKNSPEDYRSLHETWWEILEEYQAGLLGNHEDFLGKYANRKTNDREASMLLMERIAGKVGGGSSPGVAVYESIDEMAKGGHVDAVVRAAISAALEIKVAAAQAGNDGLAEQAKEFIKEAQFLGNVWKGVKNVGDFLLGKRVPSTLAIGKNLMSKKDETVRSLGMLRKRAEANPGNVLLQDVVAAVRPVYQELKEYQARAKLIGWESVDVPPLAGAFTEGAADMNKLASTMQMVIAALESVSIENAKVIDAYLKKQFPNGLDKPALQIIAEGETAKSVPAAQEAPAAQSNQGQPQANAKPQLSPDEVFKHAEEWVGQDPHAAYMLMMEIGSILKGMPQSFQTSEGLAKARELMGKRREAKDGKQAPVVPIEARNVTPQPGTTQLSPK